MGLCHLPSAKKAKPLPGAGQQEAASLTRGWGLPSGCLACEAHASAREGSLRPCQLLLGHTALTEVQPSQVSNARVRAKLGHCLATLTWLLSGG